MTVSDDPTDELLATSNNVSSFVAQYSPETIQGYKLALEHIFAEIEEIAFKRHPGVLNPQGTVRRRLLEFYSEKNKLLHLLKEFGVEDPTRINSPKP